MQSRGLGKGLSSLIPAAEAAGEPGAASEIPVESVQPNPQQPRRTFEDQPLQELAESIRTQGIIQPLVVRPAGDHYELIAGERRWRAAQLAGLTHVPVVMRQADDAEMLRVALVENIQREDLNPIDRAVAYRSLLEDFGATQEALAKAMGRSRTAIANTVRLLKLPPEIQDRVASGHLSEGHGRALLSVTNEAERHMIWRKIEAASLSVREAEELVRRTVERDRGEKPAEKPAKQAAAPESDPFIDDLEVQLIDALGTEVQIKRGRGDTGTIGIRFYGDDDLDRLTRLILALADVPSAEGLGLSEVE